VWKLKKAKLTCVQALWVCVKDSGNERSEGQVTIDVAATETENKDCL